MAFVGGSKPFKIKVAALDILRFAKYGAAFFGLIPFYSAAMPEMHLAAVVTQHQYNVHLKLALHALALLLLNHVTQPS